MLGPDSSVAPLIFAAIVPLLVTDDPSEAIALAGMMALMVGADPDRSGSRQAGLRRRPALQGGAGRLHERPRDHHPGGPAAEAFGFSTDADGFIDEVRAFFAGLDQTNTTALAIGLATLAVLLILPLVMSKIPAVLVAVVGATVVTGVFDLADEGVDVVGALPQGLPNLTFPSVPLDTLGALLAASVGIVLVSLTDTIATSTSFAARRGDDVNPNQEMIGMGGANMAAGLFRGSPSLPAVPAPAVAEQSGSKSQVTGLAGAGIVAVLLLFLPTLLQNLPQPALAAVVIAAALTLFNFGILRTYLRMRKSALVISLITSLGVILFGVLEGILIAVILSILLFFRRNWWPEGEVLGSGGRTRRVAQRWIATPSPSKGTTPWSTAGRRRSSSRTQGSSAKRSATSCVAESRGGSCSSVRRSPTST